MSNKTSITTFLLLLFFLFTSTTRSRSILSSELISDGINSHTTSWPFLFLNNPFGLADETCEQTYGFLPCTTTVLGNLFLILVYGYLMFVAATYLSGGSELLLEILGPGIVGGLFLPVLGSLPDALLILVSGLSGTAKTAQDQVSVGMGLLAGSTIMLLTLIWGSCVVVGKCDIRDSMAIDGQDTKGFSLTGTGVSTDIWTCYAARIMTISVVPLVIVQIPQILQSNSGRHLAVLISLIISVLLLIFYCLYQVFQPWVQRRRIAYAKNRHVISGILEHFKKDSFGKFLNEDGEPNIDVLKKLFSTIDIDHNNLLSTSELRALIIGIQFEGEDFDKDDAADKLMKDFDTSNDALIDEAEFVNGITKWIHEAKKAGGSSAESGLRTKNYINNFHSQAKREHELLGMEEQSDEKVGGVENTRRTSIKAILMLLLGAVMAAVFADPLVDAVDDFSDATSIPSFFISFIALPFATNSSEGVSAIIFASRKKVKTASLTFSELYGSATMNNVLCLSVFLALVYVRGLTWDFSSEVLVILIVCIVMGAFASFRITFPLWTSLLAFILYPLSLALVYVLDYVFGWS